MAETDLKEIRVRNRLIRQMLANAQPDPFPRDPFTHTAPPTARGALEVLWDPLDPQGPRKEEGHTHYEGPEIWSHDLQVWLTSQKPGPEHPQAQHSSPCVSVFKVGSIYLFLV